MNNLNLHISSWEILEQDSTKSSVESPDTNEVLAKTDSKEVTAQMNKKIQTLLSTLTKDPISDKNIDFDNADQRKLISQSLEKLSPEDKNKEAYKELTSYLTVYNTNQEAAKKALDTTQLQITTSLDSLKQQILNTPKVEADKNKTATTPKVENQSEATEQQTEVLPFEQIKNKVAEAPKEQVVAKLNTFLTNGLDANPRARIPGKEIKRGAENEGSLWVQKAINMVNGEDTLTIDGKYGNKSYEAVKTFQSSQKLEKIDGLAGKETITALIKQINIIAPKPNTPEIEQAVVPATNKAVEKDSSTVVVVESTKVDIKEAPKDPSLKIVQTGDTPVVKW